MATSRRRASEAIREARFWRGYHQHRYAILFYTLLFALAVMPAAPTFGLGVGAIESVLGIVLVAAVMPLGTIKTRRALLIGIAILLVARPLASEAHQTILSNSTLGLWAVIGLLASGAALRFVLKATNITGEHVYAALSAYLLAGIFFGLTYWTIEQAWPGSFAGPSEFSRDAAVYFSFVTIATLGYGDFLPKSDMARGLVVFEVVGGQLFLAVMIARLVSLYSSSRKGS